MTNTKLTRPTLIWAVLACMLSFSCAHSGTAAGTSGGTGTGTGSASGGYLPSDLDGDWVGVLYPNANVLNPFNFYFSAADSGIVSEAADSKGNEWLLEDSRLTAEIDSAGRIMADFDSEIKENRLYLTGRMSVAMNELTGDYEYANKFGIAITGTFILARSTGNDYFADLDYSGIWSGGFGVGYHENMRQLDFVLEADGTVISGSMTNRTNNGTPRHEYSEGSGNFSATRTNIGRIDGIDSEGNKIFVLTADDGSQATVDFLLIDHELTRIGGEGHDRDVGYGTIEISRE
jgi:hypothetical protein